MNTVNKILFVKSNDISTLWTDSEEAIIHSEWWVYTKFPIAKGIYVWEAGVGVRAPTNKEWVSVFKNENPFSKPETGKIILGSWVRERKKAA